MCLIVHKQRAGRARSFDLSPRKQDLLLYVLHFVSRLIWGGLGLQGRMRFPAQQQQMWVVLG